MPVHDWSQTLAGYFHDFHQAWSVEIRKALNAGRLPPDYYALVEQRDPRREADVLTLQVAGSEPDWEAGEAGGGTMTLTDAPPKVRSVQRMTEAERYADRANVVSIRHASGDRPVATIEIVSPGNKDRVGAVTAFCEKLDECVSAGRHFLLIDILPPTPAAPEGLHAAYWSSMVSGGAEPLPPGEPLCLAAYRSERSETGYHPEAYLNPVAIGAELPEMPVFLTEQRYVNVPLAETYEATWDAVPAPVKRRVEAGEPEPPTPGEPGT